MSHRSDIEAVKKAVARYEAVTGAKVNFDKSEGLRLGARRDGVSPAWIPPLERPTGVKLIGSTDKSRSAGWYLASRGLSLKGRAEMCATYVLPLIFYQLSVPTLPKDPRRALKQSFSKLL